MRRYRSFMLMLLFLLTASVTVADDVTVAPTITDAEIKAARLRFLSLQGKKLDPALLDSLKQLIKNNPKAKPEELAKKLLEQRPELKDPKNLDSLRNLLKQVTGSDALPTKLPELPSGKEPAAATPPTEPTQKQPAPKQPSDPPQPSKPPIKTPESPKVSEPSASKGKITLPKIEDIIKDATSTPKANPSTPDVTAPSEPKIDGSTQPITPPESGSSLPEVKMPTYKPNEREYQMAAQWWEKNFGPLKDSPAVNDLLSEFLRGTSGTNKSPFAKMLEGTKLPNMEGGSLPKGLNLPGLNLGSSLPNLPQGPSTPTGLNTPSFGGFSLPSLGDGLWVGLVLLMLAAAAFWILRKTNLWADQPKPLRGLGPWPIDPRQITNRDDLMLAFEYLSLLSIGDTARHYHHVTIATELQKIVPQSMAETVSEVANYYAWARYTPPTEELPAEQLAAARVALCRLAGVNP